MKPEDGNKSVDFPDTRVVRWGNSTVAADRPEFSIAHETNILPAEQMKDFPPAHEDIPYPDQSGKKAPALVDNHGRAIDYLRLGITDRCNLRCRYCMPDSRKHFVPHDEILTYEEMVRLVRVFVSLGIRKLRITGGEPFVRRNCLALLEQLAGIEGLRGVFITTNGVATSAYLGRLQAIGVKGINLSLDTLDPVYFRKLTGRDELGKVLDTLYGCLERSIPLKINTVILDETTDETILAMADLARKYPLTVRFIEKMPFSGQNSPKDIGRSDLRKRLKELFELSEVATDHPSTAAVFRIPGFAGRLGVIEGNSRRFCATCNKLRVTPLGILKTCLYDNGVADLKKMIRTGAGEEAVRSAIRGSVARRFATGQLAESECHRGNEPSMASIGG